MTWAAALPAILTAMALAVGPGLLVTAPLRLGVLARVAISGIVGVCVTGLAATVFGALGVALEIWQVAVVAVVGFGLVFLLRRAVPRLEQKPDRRTWLVAMLWALSALAATVITFWRVPSPERISQTYDNVFHLSATSAIVDGVSASPFTLRSLIETEGGGISYYPSAWHSLAALTAQTGGVSVPVAFNAAWIAMVAVVWLPGIAWLVRLLVPTWVAPIVAMPLGVSFGWFPYGLLTWGTIYPTAFAHALLPAAVGLSIIAVRAVVSGDVFTERPDGGAHRQWAVAIIGVLIAIGAIGLAHPRVLPTWALILAPYVLWQLGAAYLRARRRGGDPARWARQLLWGGVSGVALVGALGFVYAVIGLGLFEQPLTERLNGPQAAASQSIVEGIGQVVMLRSLTGVQGIVTLIAPLLALVVIMGAVAAFRRPGLRWILVAYLALTALYVLAAGSDDGVTKLLTGVWYKDRYRLAAALPVLAVPLATIGLVVLGRLIVPAKRGVAAGVAVVASAVIAVTATGTLASSGVSESTGVVFHQPERAADWEVVSTQQVVFMRDEVATIVPNDQRVLGDPWDGSALTGLYADREPVFPHVNGQWDHDRRVLAWDLDKIESDPSVCDALDALRVRYVLYNPHSFGGGDPAGNHFPGPHAAVEADLFTPAATDGESTLYRIGQCGPLD